MNVNDEILKVHLDERKTLMDYLALGIEISSKYSNHPTIPLLTYC